MHMSVSDHLADLQGSVVSCQLSTAAQEATEENRQSLKSQLRLAWSKEAVKQGVMHAKKAEYDAALGCYKKVCMCASSMHSFRFAPYSRTAVISHREAMQRLRITRHTPALHDSLNCHSG